MDAAELAALLQEAEQHHGTYESHAPKHNWWDWYAAFIVARQQGKSADEAYHDASVALENAQR